MESRPDIGSLENCKLSAVRTQGGGGAGRPADIVSLSLVRHIVVLLSLYYYSPTELLSSQHSVIKLLVNINISIVPLLQ